MQATDLILPIFVAQAVVQAWAHESGLMWLMLAFAAATWVFGLVLSERRMERVARR